MAEDSISLEHTPTWIVAVVCFIFVLISLAAERGLHLLGKWLKSEGRESVYEALQKIKTELMLLGFISLLLSASQGFISDMCIPTHFTSFMLPCREDSAGQEGNIHGKYAFQPSWGKRRLLAEGGNHCAKKGKAQFMSMEAFDQLHIFIFVLAVVYVIFCAATMILGGLKVRRWKPWEDSLRREIRNDFYLGITKRVDIIHARHHHEFFKQHRGHSTIVGIMTHSPSNLNYDFHKYMLRTLEYDFNKVVGISWYLWVFVVLFLLINFEGWHVYFWISFLPLILLLVVGTKLQHIIMHLANDIEEKQKENNQIDNNPEGTDEKRPWVMPSDKHFWFGRPSIFLYLMHFILFQNSFEVAFILWVLFTDGIHSCIFDRGFIIPRLVIGVIVQVLCGYSTLPLYTIVSQMGSAFEFGNFAPEVHEILRYWIQLSREDRDLPWLNRVETQNLASELHEVMPTSDKSICSAEGFTAP